MFDNNYLTARKICIKMAHIKLGDRITFDSMKESFDSQGNRNNNTIKAVGTVVEHCGGYLIVKLRRGVLESVNYFGIEKVNGKPFRGYVRQGAGPYPTEEMTKPLW